MGKCLNSKFKVHATHMTWVGISCIGHYWTRD